MFEQCIRAGGLSEIKVATCFGHSDATDTCSQIYCAATMGSPVLYLASH